MQDPVTGRFMGISTVYRITAQPAFVVDPDPARPVGIQGLAAEEWRKASFEAAAAALIKSTSTRIIQDVPPGTTEAQAPRLERIIQELPGKEYFLKMLDRPHYRWKVDEVGMPLVGIPEDPVPGPPPEKSQRVSVNIAPRP